MEPFSSQPETGRETTEVAASTFQYDIPGLAMSVVIDFDLVDRLSMEIMRGFGAVPKRGAEVGGILLGSADMGDRTTVHIEDFVSVPCVHLHGPSYILSEADSPAFAEAVERWTPAPDKRIYVVGYFRSNTRDQFQLGGEDQELLETHFPWPGALCLLVKPYATKPSEARLFVREDGAFRPDEPQGSFPFRRRELGGGKPPRRARPSDRQSEAAESSSPGLTPLMEEAETEIEPPRFLTVGASSSSETETSERAKPRTGWFWIPLSFIFLMLGIVLGFQIALAYRNQQNGRPAGDPYALDLAVVQFGENLHLKWNTEAAAFHQARRGVLHIQDGDNSKVVELKQEDLSRGGVLYRNATNNVRFRLEVYPRERNSVGESVELRLLDAPK